MLLKVEGISQRWASKRQGPKRTIGGLAQALRRQGVPAAPFDRQLGDIFRNSPQIDTSRQFSLRTIRVADTISKTSIQKEE